MEASALRHAGRVPALTGRSPLLRLQGDEKLIAMIRRGHQGAFETLVQRYQARLLAFCRHMLGSTEDAEDVLQEVFASAYRAINADERPINARPWLYRIARNRCLNHLRRPVPSGQDSMDIFERDGGTSTADTVHKRQEFRDIVADVHELPETQRTALLLREMDALSYEQIAEAMDNTVPSVKSLLVRARVSLAEAAEARLLSCDQVRMELGEVAEGLSKSTPPGRRHLKGCDRCRRFKGELRRTNRALAAIYPLGPLVIFHKLVLVKLGVSAAAGGGSSAAAGGGVGLGLGGAAGGGLGAGAAGAGAGGAGLAAGAGAGASLAAGAGAAAGGASLAAGATGAGIAAASAGGGVAGGAIGAGASALATKAAAGVMAAAIVTAGAVEVKHVSSDRSAGGQAATAVVERKELEVPKAKAETKAPDETAGVIDPESLKAVTDPSAATEASVKGEVAPDAAAVPAAAAAAPEAAPVATAPEPANGGAKAPDATAPATSHPASTPRPAPPAVSPSAPAGEPASTPAHAQPAPTAGEQRPRSKPSSGTATSPRDGSEKVTSDTGASRSSSTQTGAAAAPTPAAG